jgi:hypothetical protein
LAVLAEKPKGVPGVVKGLELAVAGLLRFD